MIEVSSRAAAPRHPNQGPLPLGGPSAGPVRRGVPARLARNAKVTAIALCTLIAFLPPAHAAKPQTRIRAEIPAEVRWDFSAIYPSWQAWEAGVAEMETKMEAFACRSGPATG